MSRKPNPVPPPDEPSDEAGAKPDGQHPHALPVAGGCYVLKDGQLVPDLSATAAPTPEPEV